MFHWSLCLGVSYIASHYQFMTWHHITTTALYNSLFPVRCGCHGNVLSVIFKYIVWFVSWEFFVQLCAIVLRSMTRGLTVSLHKFSQESLRSYRFLVQLMVYIPLTTNQCWRRFMTPYGITRLQFRPMIQEIADHDCITGQQCEHLPPAFLLTHCGLATPYGDRDLGQHWPR